ncbi:MAG: sigma-54-dependent Fis family transcriptional regulator [Phycisphaeraceae bacterium]|nr:sigma-54-dependent Fis family transcriptional regulator [Phycisphaeraceae bacterium]
MPLSQRQGGQVSGIQNNVVEALPVQGDRGHHLVGASAAMQKLRGLVAAVAPRRCTVLIQGETGTGKELVAGAIHSGSARRDGPFVPVDCTGLPETLIESQLFGHVKGAFTGAGHDAIGFIRSADGGTLFLDEIGELPTTAQAKLLRFIQERRVTPIGAVRAIEVDVRVIAATHRDLSAMVREGRFREDLFYRLNAATLEVPPLRQRSEDVLQLAEHYLVQIARMYEEPVKRLSDEAAAALQRCPWPGNVRQLVNAIEHAVVFCPQRTIGVEDLPRGVVEPAGPAVRIEDCLTTLAEAERHLIGKALHVAKGNLTQAARLIGVERHRLRRKMNLYHVQWSPVAQPLAR